MSAKLHVKDQIRGLALARNLGERITIHTSDGPIEIQVTRINPHSVKLKIAAAPFVRIARSELDVQGTTETPPIESDYD